MKKMLWAVTKCCYISGSEMCPQLHQPLNIRMVLVCYNHKIYGFAYVVQILISRTDSSIDAIYIHIYMVLAHTYV